MMLIIAFAIALRRRSRWWSPSAAEADRAGRVLPARLHVIRLVLRAPQDAIPLPPERHLSMELDPQRQLLPAQRQPALIRSETAIAPSAVPFFIASVAGL